MARTTGIFVRRGTAASWTSGNPTLATGEFGLETDTKRLKLGVGSAWNSTPYQSFTASITAPTGVEYGHRWLDETSGIMYVWYVDADTSQWVEFEGSGSADGIAGVPLFIQETSPGISTAHLWIQTGLGDGSDMTFWVEDGL